MLIQLSSKLTASYALHTELIISFWNNATIILPIMLLSSHTLGYDNSHLMLMFMSKHKPPAYRLLRKDEVFRISHRWKENCSSAGLTHA